MASLIVQLQYPLTVHVEYWRSALNKYTNTSRDPSAIDSDINDEPIITYYNMWQYKTRHDMACIYIMASGWANHNPFDASVQYALTVGSATVCAGWCVDVHVPAYKERAIRLNFSTAALKIMEPWPILKKSQDFFRNSPEIWGLDERKKIQAASSANSSGHVEPWKCRQTMFFSKELQIQAQIQAVQIQAQIQAASNPTEFQVFINFLKILMIFKGFMKVFRISRKSNKRWWKLRSRT